MEAPPVEDASAANQQKWLKIKTITQTGEEEVGEMIIEVPQQHDQAANMSSDSLDRTDPDHLKLNVNFHLSEDGREGDGSADDFKALRPKNASDGAPPGRFDTGRGEVSERGMAGSRGTHLHTIGREQASSYRIGKLKQTSLWCLGRNSTPPPDLTWSSSSNILNLSRLFTPSAAQISLLEKGLTFIPAP